MAIILAAGSGNRLRPLTHDKPKALLAPAGVPLIASLLEVLGPDCVVVTGHGERAIRAFLGDKGVEFAHQDSRLGPGHALAQAEPPGDEFLVIPGDAWYHPDLLRRLRDAPCPAMIQVPDARSGRHGVPVVEGATVADLLEQEVAGKQATTFCGGAYKVPRRFMETLRAVGFSMRDAIRQDLADHGPWNLVTARPGEYVDMIEVQDLLKVHDRVMATIGDDVEIGEGSRVHPSAVLQGPVRIGKNCDIGPGAVLLPGTAIRNRTRVGPLSVLQRCVVGSNVVIGSHCRLEDVVVDNGARFGNYVQVEQSTGAIVGADAAIGDRATIEAGGVIGRGAKVASARSIRDVPDGAQAV